MKKILTICIPTYNRAQVTVSEIKEYLAVSDNRFVVKVCDNNSSDETLKRLRSINDTRLILIENGVNLGAKQNELKALSNNESEYVLLTLDKDKIDSKKLSEMIDFFETYKPCFGYIDLNLNVEKGVKVIDAGVNNVLQMSYLTKHPSGYFYRSDIFKEAMNEDFVKEIDKNFPFPYDIINAEIALKYPSSILYGGFIIFANYRKDINIREHLSLSIGKRNLWYDGPHRLMIFRKYLESAVSLKNLSNKDRCIICKKLLIDVIYNVSLTLRSLMKDKELSDHYHVKTHNVSLNEMLCNIKDAVRIFLQVTKNRLPFCKRILIAYIYGIYFCALCIKDFFLTSK